MKNDIVLTNKRQKKEKQTLLSGDIDSLISLTRSLITEIGREFCKVPNFVFM